MGWTEPGNIQTIARFKWQGGQKVELFFVTTPYVR